MNFILENGNWDLFEIHLMDTR